MKGSQQQREEAILNICENYALKQKGSCIISFWQLACELNNCWYAKLFVSREFAEKDTIDRENFAIEDYNLFKFRRMVYWTLRRMKGVEFLKPKYPEYFKIKIKRCNNEL